MGNRSEDKTPIQNEKQRTFLLMITDIDKGRENSAVQHRRHRHGSFSCKKKKKTLRKYQQKEKNELPLLFQMLLLGHSPTLYTMLFSSSLILIQLLLKITVTNENWIRPWWIVGCYQHYISSFICSSHHLYTECFHVAL